MARKSFVDIPQELVEKIMDSLDPDGAIQTLRSLSTVSQHLRPLAHQRLFKSITISTRMPSSNTDDSDVGTSRRRRRSLAVKLLDALVDAPYLAVYTAQLAIILDDYDDDDSDYTSPTGNSDSNDPSSKKRPILSAEQAIPKILHHYLTHNADTSTSKLRKFAIRQSNWSSTGYTIPTGWMMRERVVGVLGLGSLVHVELKNVAIEILRVLGPSVRHVALWNPRLEGELRKEIEAEMVLEVKDKDKDKTPESSTVPSGPEKQGSSSASGSSTRLKIQSLLIDDATVIVNSQNTNAVALRWLLAQDDLFDFTKLQKLRVGMTYCDRQKGHRQLARLLGLCAESLKEFSFSPALSSFTGTDPDAPETEEEDPITPALSTLHSLTFLHIGAQTGFWRPDTQNTLDPIPWICTQLSSLPSPLNSSASSNPSDRNYSNLKTIIISSSYGMMAVPTLPLPSPGMMMMGPPRIIINYFGPDFTSYSMLDVLLSSSSSPTSTSTSPSPSPPTTRFPSLQKLQFHIEEAPFYKDYNPPPHTFGLRAKWTELTIKKEMRLLSGGGLGGGGGFGGGGGRSQRQREREREAERRRGKVDFVVESNLFPYSTRLLLDAEW